MLSMVLKASARWRMCGVSREDIMADQRLKTEEWELVKENYHFIPPALRECFEEVAVA